MAEMILWSDESVFWEHNPFSKNLVALVSIMHGSWSGSKRESLALTEWKKAALSLKGAFLNACFLTKRLLPLTFGSDLQWNNTGVALTLAAVSPVHKRSTQLRHARVTNGPFLRQARTALLEGLGHLSDLAQWLRQRSLSVSPGKCYKSCVADLRDGWHISIFQSVCVASVSQ